MLHGSIQTKKKVFINGSIKSCYFFILDRRQLEELDSDALEAVKKLWKNPIFGLRLLLDRLST
jgi:hypothetical protein